MKDIFETREQTPKVLIADDDPAVVRLLADRCAKMGFKVETALNGVQLLVKARRDHPDLVIVDVNMPELDGLSVCTRLLDPGRKPLDVVVVTGSTDPETPERCESLGMYFGRKGPDFWKNIEAAIMEIYPDMEKRLAGMEAMDAEVPQRPRVLVVDDDPDIEKFLAPRLDKYGVDTLFALDATQAYRIAVREKPSVIITDNYMPDGDAHHLLCRLRATPGTENIPVFVISGRPISDTEQQLLKRDVLGHPGVTQIFSKSFDTQQLFNALQRYCGFGKASA
jgi:CheY-like chemotaxis protein